ncbi:MAG: hypothetical protein HY749_23260 [Gammaproteobacteria bacterium]|nr:hypothetical protein [Gammaproteobacteria bacterium]
MNHGLVLRLRIVITGLCLTFAANSEAAPDVDAALKRELTSDELAALVAFATEQYRASVVALTRTRCGAPAGNLCVAVDFDDVPVGGNVVEQRTAVFFLDRWLERDYDTQVEDARIRLGAWRTSGELAKVRTRRFDVGGETAYIQETDPGLPDAQVRELLEAIGGATYTIDLDPKIVPTDKQFQDGIAQAAREFLNVRNVVACALNGDHYELTVQQHRHELGAGIYYFRKAGEHFVLIGCWPKYV